MPVAAPPANNAGAVPQVKTASGQVEPDLFAMPVQGAASASPQPKPVDKAGLMNAYNNTPYGQQQQQQQMMYLQQQAYLAQQQQLQSQMAAAQMYAPQPQHAAASPAGFGAFNTQTNAFSAPNAFAPSPNHAFGSPAANAFGAPSAQYASPQPPASGNASLLASLYAQPSGTLSPSGSSAASSPSALSGYSNLHAAPATGYQGNSYSFPSPATTPNGQGVSLSFALGVPVSSPSSTSSSISLI